MWKVLWLSLVLLSGTSFVSSVHEARACDATVVAPQVFVQPQVVSPALFFTPSVAVMPSVMPAAVYACPNHVVAVHALAVPTVVREKIVIRQARPVISVQRTFSRTRIR